MIKQVQQPLDLMPDLATSINDRVSVVKQNGVWIYFHGIQAVFQHRENDVNSHHLALAQLCVNGLCQAGEVTRALKVSHRSLCRYIDTYRTQGAGGFYQRKPTRGPSVMTPEVIAKAQEMLDAGKNRSEIKQELSIEADTLRKAIKSGRLKELTKRADPPVPVIAEARKSENNLIDKSARSQADAEAGEGIGIACTRSNDRLMASIGGLVEGAKMEFQEGRDVSFGGVLCALPALAANGLFNHLDILPVLRGYYTTLHVILVMAFMALCRIKSVEQLQTEQPGELGKLIGLDRVPEVRCLREKLASLSLNEAPQQWAGLLSQAWMTQDPDSAGILYIDGHVRLYHGKLTKLPKRFVSRQRLCLRGTTDYWINDALGRPFFCVERTIDHGLLEVLRHDIIPRLLHDVPNQPSDQQLKDDRYRSRFIIIFDREGYSPSFFRDMWNEHRIACITYHKFPKDTWPESWFTDVNVRMPGGEIITMKLAEMGSWIGDPKSGLWVREVRKLCESGHQTSLISTAYDIPGPQSAAQLFNRWCQENFFRYMMENYAIDTLAEIGTEQIPGTSKPVVNPLWRALDRQVQSMNAKLQTRRARFADLLLHPKAQGAEILQWEKKKASYQEEIEHFERETMALKDRKKNTPHYVAWEDLPEKDQFERLAPGRKRLVDTIRLVAYRAETAMALIIKDKMSRPDEARSLIRSILCSDADIHPDTAANILYVKLHTLATPRSNQAAQYLLDHLNAAEFIYPGTNLRLYFLLPTLLPESQIQAD